jgi:hypothetical protein
LEDCAGDDDPDRELARTPAGSGQCFYGGDLLNAGLNSTRGAAGRTIARLLFASPMHADRLTPTIVKLATNPGPGGTRLGRRSRRRADEPPA